MCLFLEMMYSLKKELPSCFISVSGNAAIYLKVNPLISFFLRKKRRKSVILKVWFCRKYTCTVSENTIGIPKMWNDFWYPIKMQNGTFHFFFARLLIAHPTLRLIFLYRVCIIIHGSFLILKAKSNLKKRK